MEWISKVAKALDIELLPEVHAHYTTQYKLAEHGYWIYDFILPYIVLDATIKRTSKDLYTYLRDRPEKQFTMLDCHDGVPVKPDMNDLYSGDEARALVNTCLDRGGNLSLIYSPKHKDEDGFDVHQIRGTYYSLLDCDDDAYIAARAIQLFVPGVPQVYYVGLLAGENDIDAYKEGGDGRVINRHNYSIEEIEDHAKKDVVKRLVKLIQFRNTYPAFDGEFKPIEGYDDQVHLAWKKGKKMCELKIDLKRFETSIEYVDDDGKKVLFTA
jgi:sucrose phosphorylase